MEEQEKHLEREKNGSEKKFSIQLLGHIFQRANGVLRIGRKKEPEARVIVELDF